MVTVFLALGSNLGDRKQNLHDALRNLKMHVRLTACSAIYESAPLHVTEQPMFLNCVCAAETDLQPFALLAICKQIEVLVGRLPSFRYGPRVVDVDIVSYDGLVENWTDPWLELPHPRLSERAFVTIVEHCPSLARPAFWFDSNAVIGGASIACRLAVARHARKRVIGIVPSVQLCRQRCD